MRTIKEEKVQVQEATSDSDRVSMLLGILNWGYGDFEELITRIDRWAELYIKNGLSRIDLDELTEHIEENYGREGLVDINSFFMALFDKIFFEIIQKLREDFGDDDELMSALDDLEDDYSPYINYLDSWFNNIFDEIHREMSLSEIADLIKNNAA